jgi:hypothetical protein
VQIRSISEISGEVFAFPISAIPRDYGDPGDLVN